MSLSLMAAASLAAQQYTRGVGVYPGNPKDYFGPTMRVDGAAYRNLALHRPAYHSSSYDYNLTAQLVTDGIKDTRLPRWVASATSQQGALKKNERERLLDRNPMTVVELKGTGGWVQIELGGGDGAPEVDRVDVQARVQAASPQPGWKCVVSGSDDGAAWKELGRSAGTERPAALFRTSIALAAPSRSRFYRVEVEAPGALVWRVGEVSLFDKNRQLEIGGPYDFTSAWMSEGSGEEWVYVDLGAPCEFDRVALYWIRRAAEGSIEVSDDAASWRAVQALPATTALIDDLKLAQPAKGRYVRVRMTRPASPEGYILSEMEVWGRGGPVAVPKAAARGTYGRLDLAGGAWRIQRDSLVAAGGEALSRVGFDDRDWLVATVPGTALVSYVNAGALPDPNYGDNQLMISDSFFYADFWYRDEFVATPSAAGRREWLNFDGINWKADVFLNGEKIGRIEGAFMRGRFDVTGRLKPGQRNALALRIVRNATPGSVREKTWQSPDKNGGALGADNPTYHATVGWDWIPVVRGRDTGIWKNVYITTSGPVTIENPFVTTVLALPAADIQVEATLTNHEAKPVSGTLRGSFGDDPFEMPVALGPSEEKTVKTALHLANPKLWWPAGYGAPNLYKVEMKFVTADKAVSDAKRFETGVRQFTYRDEGGALRIWINGRRFIARGGNWGFPESMLLYRGREYDVAVGYHADMHFTMIRNWVGQTGDEEFYEACDRHGIVVWQDFWLANPADGPDPDDNGMFLRNVRDYVLKVRDHVSIGLYCGRNEGYPPKPIDEGIRKTLAELHPDIHYIPSSADDTVEGHGPYGVRPTRFYFEQRATPKLHSELGMPNIMSLDSVRQTMPEAALWPQGRMWGLHDFCLGGAQQGAAFRAVIDDGYGGAANAEEWLTLAQFVNYEGHRAMYEAQSRNRMGLLIWMSHPAWPSFVWQTYDYYFEPTAAYFGAKKASEPLHIQWNIATDSVEVVNYSGGNAAGLTARAEIRNMDGALKWAKEVPVESAEDSDVSCIKMEYPQGLTPVHFIRLKLTRGGETVSENFYWRGLQEGAYRAIRQLPKVKIEAATRAERQGGRWQLKVDLHNVSAQPALMVKLKVVREKSGDRILPALYSDNYVALMPGERRTIGIEVEDADTRGEKPRVAVDGFNVGEVAEK
ncbi:MAG: discoidin domain-containing protein [Bryobacteraceae bacterium]